MPEISLTSLLFVFIGGGLGSLCRFVIGKISVAHFGDFPYGTLAANLIGACLAGIAAVLIFHRKSLESPFSDLFLAGFLGGLTTFSSMILDAHTLIAKGEPHTAIIYVALNIIVGLLLFTAAFYLTRAV